MFKTRCALYLIVTTYLCGAEKEGVGLTVCLCCHCSFFLLCVPVVIFRFFFHVYHVLHLWLQGYYTTVTARKYARRAHARTHTHTHKRPMNECVAGDGVGAGKWG